MALTRGIGASPMGSTGVPPVLLRPTTRHRDILLAALAFVACACGSDGSGPVPKDNLDPMVKNKDLPIADQIAAIESNKNMPDPEKQRYLSVLRAKQAAGAR